MRRLFTLVLCVAALFGAAMPAAGTLPPAGVHVAQPCHGAGHDAAGDCRCIGCAIEVAEPRAVAAHSIWARAMPVAVATPVLSVRPLSPDPPPPRCA